MNQSIFNYLKNYGTDIYSINRLLVSSYLRIHTIDSVKNYKINSYIIKEDELEYSQLVQFIGLIKQVDRDFTFEELLELFEFVISPSDKLINGAIYTPSDIRGYITKECFLSHKADISNAKIVDISCGCGGFLIDATKMLKETTNKSYKQIYKENIFGIDIQAYSIERTEILLSLLAIEKGEDEKVFEFNLYIGNSLEFDWRYENEQIKKSGGFDIILGNPPYVCSRNMDDKTKSLMTEWSTCTTGHPDLYIPFFQIGFELLKPNGVLGYITVNSFIQSLNGRAVRTYFQDKKVDLKIIDFGNEQIFKSRMTYTSICFLTNKQSYYIQYIPLKRDQLEQDFQYQKHYYDELSIENGWYFKNRDLVKNIESIGIQFGDIYNTKSGIATLKNHVYIFKPIKESEEYYFIDENTMIEKQVCKNIINSNLLVKTNQIDSFIEKIIFPYAYDENNKVYVIAENELQKKYPKTYEYLLGKKEELAIRDKGKGKDYLYWYAFGRNQSLEKSKYKLLFPQLARKGFQSCISDDEDLYFYNGMGALSDNLEELQILQKIFMTDVFWTYVSSISKHYASNYFSLGRNFIKYFGIYEFTKEEKKYLLEEKNISRLNDFMNKLYNV